MWPIGRADLMVTQEGQQYICAATILHNIPLTADWTRRFSPNMDNSFSRGQQNKSYAAGDCKIVRYLDIYCWPKWTAKD